MKLLLEVGVVGFAREESVSKGGLQRLERRRPGLEGLEQLPYLKSEGGVVAAVAIEGMLGADGAALEEHPDGVEMTGEAGVVEGDGVPLVAGVDVDAGLQ